MRAHISLDGLELFVFVGGRGIVVPGIFPGTKSKTTCVIPSPFS